jgi:hypothetical protein
MSNDSHPLVGKKIVDKVLAQGQVSKDQIKLTLGDVMFIPNGSWCIDPIKGWCIYTDQDVITKVQKT